MRLADLAAELGCYHNGEGAGPLSDSRMWRHFARGYTALMLWTGSAALVATLVGPPLPRGWRHTGRSSRCGSRMVPLTEATVAPCGAQCGGTFLSLGFCERKLI